MDEVLNLASKLNEFDINNGYITVRIEGLDATEIKALCRQENGSYFKGDNIILPADWGSVKLGNVEFILSSKKTNKVIF